jgi:hypothetical protein
LKKIDKILQYIDNQGIDIAKFERESDISNGYFGNTHKRGADITDKILEKIRQKQPKIYTEVFGTAREPQPTQQQNANSMDEDYRIKFEQLLQEQNVLLKKQNEQLADALDTVRTMAKGIESNLNKAVKGNVAHQTMLSVNQAVFFSAMEELLHLEPGTLAERANNERAARLQKILKKDSADI